MNNLLTPHFHGRISGSGAASTAPTLTGIGGSDMAKRTCSVDDCERKMYSRGWCLEHYRRWQRHVDPAAGRPSSRTVLQTLAEAVEAETDECILWPHARWQRGYGVVSVDGARRGVHIVVCEQRHGLRPTIMHEAAHACGVRLCVNPRHLRWATHAENMADVVIHGTQRGERNPAAKLTAAAVLEIRRRAVSESSVALAREFGVACETISSVIRRQSWAWLDPSNPTPT